MKLTETCRTCGTAHTTTIDVSDVELFRYHAGELVQNVWPTASADDREIIMANARTGFYICPVCWGSDEA